MEQLEGGEGISSRLLVWPGGVISTRLVEKLYFQTNNGRACGAALKITNARWQLEDVGEGCQAGRLVRVRGSRGAASLGGSLEGRSAICVGARAVWDWLSLQSVGERSPASSSALRVLRLDLRYFLPVIFKSTGICWAFRGMRCFWQCERRAIYRGEENAAAASPFQSERLPRVWGRCECFSCLCLFIWKVIYVL